VPFCRVSHFLIVMLNVVMLSVVRASVTFHIVMLTVVRLNVVMLNNFMPSVTFSYCYAESNYTECRYA
jgi:hypothetical protein